MVDRSFISKKDDDLILELAKGLDIEDELPQEVVKNRVDLVKMIYLLVKKSVDGEDVEVSYKIHRPYKSVGVVSVNGKNIVVKNTGFFSKALKLSGNFDVSTKTNGDIHMDFMIYELTKIVED